MGDLLPCPFCHAEAPDVHLSPITGVVFCEGCGAEGPWSPFFDGDWNTRALPAASPADHSTPPPSSDAFLPSSDGIYTTAAEAGIGVDAPAPPLPDRVMVWRSYPSVPWLGTWSTIRFPHDAVAYVPETALDSKPASGAPAHAEPVAWRIRLAGDDPEEWTLHHNAVDYLDRPQFECQPLYTHPTPAPVVPAEGLAERIAIIISGAPFPSARSRAKADAILTALRAQQPAAPVSGVTVKPLVWELEPDRDADFPKWTAETGLGETYHIFKAWWGAQDKWGFVGIDGFYHSEAEAKAAAQADYEACIRAALTPNTAQEEG